MFRQLQTGGLVLGILVAGTGCAGLVGPSAGEGRSAFLSMQKAVASASAPVEKSLVYINIRSESSSSAGQQIVIGGINLTQGGGGSRSMTGLVLTKEGHVLVPEPVKLDGDQRIEAWIGDEEYVARPVKVDDALGMTILKINPAQPLTPVDWSQGADLVPGEWALVVTPSDKTTDFVKFTTLTTCRGEIAGRYRRYIVSGLSRDSKGAPVLNLSGQVVGLLDNMGAQSIVDLRDDLESFLNEATGVKSPDEEEKQKGWLGAHLEAVNEDLAKSKGWPISSIWVAHVSQGSAAEQGGLKAGDLVLELNGRPLRLSGARTVEYFLKSLRPRTGQKFTLAVRRDDKRVELSGVIGKRPEPETVRAEDVGITVKTLVDTDVFENNLFVKEGMLVTDVIKGSPAATSSSFGRSLLSKGDVIVELAGLPTPDAKAFGRVLDKVRRDRPDVVLVKYRRGRLTGYEGLNLKIGEQNGGDKQ